MKIEFDFSAKVIRVQQGVILGELVKLFEKILPKGSEFGHWKEYSIDTFPPMGYGMPITFQNPWEITCKDTNGFTVPIESLCDAPTTFTACDN